MVEDECKTPAILDALCYFNTSWYFFDQRNNAGMIADVLQQLAYAGRAYISADVPSFTRTAAITSNCSTTGVIGLCIGGNDLGRFRDDDIADQAAIVLC